MTVPEVIIMPDVVEMVTTWLTAQLPAQGVVAAVGTFYPPDHDGLDVVVVRRTGGVRRNLVTDAATLTVESYADTEADAHDIAQVARALIYAMARGGVDGIARVDEVGGLGYLPDPVNDRHRFTFAVEIAARGTAA